MLVMGVSGSLSWAPSWHDIGLEEIAALNSSVSSRAFASDRKAIREIQADAW
jgi:hypothetical protein